MYKYTYKHKKTGEIKRTNRKIKGDYVLVRTNIINGRNLSITQKDEKLY